MKEKFWSYLAQKQSTIASGLAALLIIVVGFAVFSYFSRNTSKIVPEQKVEETQGTEKAETEAKADESQNQDTAENNSNPNREVQPPTSGGAQTNYTVVRGDTLCQIAQKHLGNCNRWQEISRANNLTNPNLIHAGNVFVLPGTELAASTSNTLPKSGQDSGPPSQSENLSKSETMNLNESKTHTVQRGDSLWNIAQRYYGNGFDWIKIWEANKAVVKSFSDGKFGLIYPNQVLTIPDKP
jgi:nucleoid-associated protein YgaU